MYFIFYFKELTFFFPGSKADYAELLLLQQPQRCHSLHEWMMIKLIFLPHHAVIFMPLHPNVKQSFNFLFPSFARQRQHCQNQHLFPQGYSPSSWWVWMGSLVSSPVKESSHFIRRPYEEG